MPDLSLLSIGTALCLASAFFAWTETKKQREHALWCAGKTLADGVVSRVATRGHLSRNAPTSEDDYRTSRMPIVRFRANDGVEYEIDARDAGKPGSPVRVAYDPAAPSSAQPVESVRRLGCSVVLLVIGVFLVVWSSLE